MQITDPGGIEALHRLKATDPRLPLNPSLSATARAASRYLFSSLRPFTLKSPFDQLLVDGFDAEQIWQQIDLQSQPLLASLHRRVKQLEKNPEEVSKLKTVLGKGEKKVVEEMKEESEGLDEDSDDFDEDDEEDEDEEGEGKENEKVGLENVDEDQEDGGDSGESDSEEDNAEGGGGIEDQFLKIKDMQEFLEDGENEGRGLKKDNKMKKGGRFDEEGTEDEEEEDDDEENENDEEDDDEDDELGDFALEDDEDEENARYEDFYGAKQKKGSKKKVKFIDGSEGSDTGDEQDDKPFSSQKQETISTHEKQLEKQRSKIERMEKANMEPKNWTMQGEVTGPKRPKNSALEVDLDFEHNKRILEGHFDDVQRALRLPSKAPREIKELDENKSKKGLAEIYEEEYAQKTNLASAPLTFKDEQKKEASMLFKKLCLKLDALSHFHFTPKPVIEEMSIQANVPALAMEEIAPVAVSDAAMLAPEEVFTGKGDIKVETELTQAERKRRRANKKRKFKAGEAKRTPKKARESALPNPADGTKR
ncbi:U3 small nucleolar ribonucleoprotein MPP10 [Quillaja saponaria]|uniref:U3 small nucleolar ribonucleoprotein protein MPP10 n=1 Tax=Quillaja saponaria TaxID=32244 RepID=A0AAD7KTQ6_QUISA|nr:U3 small nucleolar ribonucleoprotein MPP10 [Quillaja saponaria]